jgi:hypothetical protein
MIFFEMLGLRNGNDVGSNSSVATHHFSNKIDQSLPRFASASAVMSAVNELPCVWRG